MTRPRTHPDELVEHGVRLALESKRPIARVAANLGMHPETLRKKRQAQTDSGARPDLPYRRRRRSTSCLP
jgi:transposase-like protein